MIVEGVGEGCGVGEVFVLVGECLCYVFDSIVLGGIYV